MEIIHKLVPPTRILVVEEYELLRSREILATIIPKRFPHAVVYPAADGKACLDLMKTHRGYRYHGYHRAGDGRCPED